MLASIPSATLVGVEGRRVTVEVHVSTGLPAYSVVGLPDAAVRESRERVRAALLSSKLAWPMKRITVNLAPAGLPKSGSGFELAVALGLLAADGNIPGACLNGVAVLGELGLDGSVRPISGVLAMVDELARSGVEAVIVPAANAREAELVGTIRVLCARTLGELRACLVDDEPWPDSEPPTMRSSNSTQAAASDPDQCEEPLELADVRGLHQARQSLEVAAAGAHHLLMIGPPGAGKTMLARRLASILPPLAHDEALEVTRIHSAAGYAPHAGLAQVRPFRMPHHTASTPALVGGGSGRPHPGEVTMAHRGVLVLDELGEWAPRSLDALRQPLEDGRVQIARQRVSMSFPAEFMLVACSNPCPCGLGPPTCRCNEAMRLRYRQRMSAPLLDRFDLRVVVTPPQPDDEPGECSDVVRARVIDAVARQRARLNGTPWRHNAHIPAGALARLVPLTPSTAMSWRDITRRRDLTGRGAARIRRVARTIADLACSGAIEVEHLLQAADLRCDPL